MALDKKGLTAEALPPDILEDLLTVYAAGEASAGTRRLIDEYRASHPAVDQRLSRPLPLAAPETKADPDGCLRTMSRVRRIQLIRYFLVGFGMTTMLVPFHPTLWADKTFVVVSECASAAAWFSFAGLSDEIRKFARKRS